MNVAIIVQLLIALINQAGEISRLLAEAHAENRDITEEELRRFIDRDDASRAALQASIERAKVK